MIRERGKQRTAILEVGHGDGPVAFEEGVPESHQVVCDACQDASAWLPFEASLPIGECAFEGDLPVQGKEFVVHDGKHLCLACWKRIKPVKSWEERLLDEDGLKNA